MLYFYGDDTYYQDWWWTARHFFQRVSFFKQDGGPAHSTVTQEWIVINCTDSITKDKYFSKLS